MAEYKTEKQVNYGWGLSLNMTGKAPAIAKRIFETLADAQAYADDVNDSAIAGLQLSVINDNDPSKNGIYFVKSIGDGTNSAVLELVGKGTISVEGGSIDLAEYAKLSDINDVKTWVENKNYLTEHQDVSNFVTKDELPVLDEYAKLEDVEGIVEDAIEAAVGDMTEVALPTFANGLENVDNTVGVKVDSESESFISVSENGIKVSGIQESIDTTFNNYLNTYPTIDAKTVYLSESEWDELTALVESGEASWEDGVTYMVYSND